MPSTTRICLYDRAPESDPGFRQAFAQIAGVEVLELCSQWNKLQEHLQFGNIDAVAVNLDVPETPALVSIQRIAEIAPACAVIGVSASADPDFIIAAMRAGCAQFVRFPIVPADLSAVLERVRKRNVPSGDGCQFLAILGSHGGAGATTLACNLALELSHLTGERTGLVDMDLQFGDIACAFDSTPKYSLADLCRSGARIDNTLIKTALEDLPCNVSILARPENIADSEDITPAAIDEVCRVLGTMFPYVVIDFPRHFSETTVHAVKAAQRVFIVSQLAVPHLRNASRMHDCLLQAGVAEDSIELILNRCNAAHAHVTPDEVEKHFGHPVFARIPNDYKHITASRDLGHPILVSAPNSPARLAIQMIARQLAPTHFGEGDGARSGLLGRIFGKRPKAGQPSR